jgi:hypothetical protein
VCFFEECDKPSQFPVAVKLTSGPDVLTVSFLACVDCTKKINQVGGDWTAQIQWPDLAKLNAERLGLT